MWKHKNFINLQLCAGETWVLNETLTASTFDVTVNFVSFNTNYTSISMTKFSRGILSYNVSNSQGTIAYNNGAWVDEAYRTLTFATPPTGVLLTWLQANGTKQSTPQSALTFKHFYDAGTIGSGTVKFRHYSQQEPTPPTYAVAITTDGANDSLCAYKLWSTADQANPTSGTMVYQNDGITSETVTIEVDKKYLVIVVVDNDGFRGADFVTVKGSVSKLSGYVVEVSGPGEAYIDRWTCLTGDTLITIADGTKKRIDELTLQDKVFAIDPETGKFVADEITYTDSTEYKTYTEYDKWTFSDGTIVKTVHRHRFYNVEKQAMVYMDEWNIGEHAVNQNGEYIALASHENVKEEVKHYTLFTKHQNYFANGLLSGNRYTAELHLKR